MTICEELRQAVLQAAIQGKLTEQREDDGTAEELLEEIRKEKERLVKEGKIKKEKALAPIDEDEIPFDIPESWRWVRLGNLLSGTDAGKSPQCEDRPKTDQEIGVIKTTAIQEYGFLQDHNKVLPSSFITTPNQFVHNGDLLITRAGPRNRTGIVCVVEDDVERLILSDKTIRLNYMLSDPYYIRTVLSSPFGKNDIETYMTGMAASQVNISQQNMRLFCIPLPPLAEQHRIVTRVNTLMEQIDSLQKIENDLISLKSTFPTTMRDSILQAAMQGKLTEQLESDGTAEELYQQIQEEKKRLIKEGKIKKEKELDPVGEDEIPFDIPENWKWVRLGNVYNVVMGQSPVGSSVLNTGGQGIEFHQGKIWFGLDYLNESDQTTTKPVKIMEPNTVLLCVRAPVGKANISTRRICIGRGLCGIVPYFRTQPIFTLNIVRYLEEAFVKQSTGTTFKAISNDIIRNQLVPLPPLAEQHRIVARLNELLPLCDTLEEAK